MTSLAYSTSLQDRIAFLLVGSAYSALTTAQKVGLDGNSATSPPTVGVVKGAWDEVTKWSQWLDMAGGTVADAATEDWFVKLATKDAALQFRPERVQQFVVAEKEAFSRFTQTFSRKAIDYNPSSDTEFSTNSYQNVRYSVVENLVRRNPPIFVPISQVDAATNRALTMLWNAFDWPFRRRSVTMTITTASAVSFSGSDTFLKMASRTAYFDDANSAGSQSMQWCDQDQMSRLLASETATSITGRPQFFRMQKAGDTPTWFFYPTPDQTYTARCEIYITGPGLPSSATSNTAFAKFPTEFQPWIRELAMAECLAAGDSLAIDTRRRIWAECERLFEIMAEQGLPDQDGETRDVYQDSSWQLQMRIPFWGGGL